MLFPLTLVTCFAVINSKMPEKRHVPNCVDPQQPEEVYNLEGWIETLHLQQCVFVAIGENFYAVFLEKRPRPYDENQEIRDLFLGICDYKTLRKWSLCPLPIESKRKEDCCFKEEGQASPRVHRRLCELSDLTQFAEHCNCELVLRGEKLLTVTGFPTCFRPQMHDTICGFNNVCGLNACTMTLISNRVFNVRCDENCFGHKPFCENPEWESAKPREINSFWTDWSEAKCADSECIAQYNEAQCINKDTGLGDVDCLGPGSSCCAGDLYDCKCHVFVEEGMAKVIRTFTVPTEAEYEELSLDEIIKNLPVKNDHRPLKIKEKPKSRQKVQRRHSMKDESYDDMYDHAYNIKLVKDNIHAKIRDRQEQTAERMWLQQKPRNWTKRLAPGFLRPENSVDPDDLRLFQRNLDWMNSSSYCSLNGKNLVATDTTKDGVMMMAAAQVRHHNANQQSVHQQNVHQQNVHQPNVHQQKVANPPIPPGQCWIAPYSKQSIFRDRSGQEIQDAADQEEMEVDADEEIKQLERDDMESDEDEDIKIEDEDTKTTTTSESPDPDEVRALQNYNRLHQNATAIDLEDNNVKKKTDSGGIVVYSSYYMFIFIIILLKGPLFIDLLI